MSTRMTSIGAPHAGALSDRGERYRDWLDADYRAREAYREQRLRELAATPDLPKPAPVECDRCGEPLKPAHKLPICQPCRDKADAKVARQKEIDRQRREAVEAAERAARAAAATERRYVGARATALRRLQARGIKIPGITEAA